MTTVQKKQLVSLIGNGVLPQNLVGQDSGFVVSEDDKHTISILFDVDSVNEWLVALSGMTHITDYYIVTENKTIFSTIKKQVSEFQGGITTVEPRRIPLSNGFAANCEFFKLGFMDKDMVSLGRQFRKETGDGSLSPSRPLTML